MRTKYVEIQEPAAPAFEQVKRFTRKRVGSQLGALSRAVSGGVPTGTAVAADDVSLEYVQSARPRRRRTRGLTTFNIVVMLIAFAVLVTVYISNVVTVDGLMMQQIELEREAQLLQQERENLRAEINTLSSYNRIQKIATEELGLVHANQQPYSLTVFGWTPEPTKK